jgi:hypothetical protein
MDLRAKIREVLRCQYGEFETILEHQYEDKLTKTLIVGNKTLREEWVTYNQVILELKHSLKDMLKVKELQYKLTEEEDPKTVTIEVMEGVKALTPELERLYNKIKNF